MQGTRNKTWYVLKTRPRQEDRAILHLENQQFTVYCPWLIRKDGVREALFTGYMFVHLQTYEDFAQSFTTIRSTRGVQQFVKYGAVWAQADQELIDLLKYRENGYRGVPLFKCNQPVLIKEGPFKGIEAVYLSVDGNQRAMVLLTILNRRAPVKIEERHLKAI